jgi:hypothetical protein
MKFTPSAGVALTHANKLSLNIDAHTPTKQANITDPSDHTQETQVMIILTVWRSRVC